MQSTLLVGLYRTSRPVWKSGKFSKSGLSGNRTFSFPDAELYLSKIFKILFCLYIWSRNFCHQICVRGPYLMRIDNLKLVGKMFKNISPDSVWCGRTCPANLGVRSCPVGKLICQVRSCPCQVFKMGCTKLERFLPSNQHTQRKLLNFENQCLWIGVKNWASF